MIINKADGTNSFKCLKLNTYVCVSLQWELLRKLIIWHIKRESTRFNMQHAILNVI